MNKNPIKRFLCWAFIIIFLFGAGYVLYSSHKPQKFQECPIVGHRLNMYGPSERWLDCNGDGQPDFKQHFIIEDGKVKILDEEYVKGKFK